MPDIKRLCMNDLMQTAEKLVLHGIHAIALFPVIDKKYKSSNGEEAYKSDGLIQKTIAKLKSEFPELLVITDVALDPYTTHGQDGIIDDNNYVTNDKTIQILKKQALSHAEAGADIVAPSDMMDGRIGARDSMKGLFLAASKFPKNRETRAPKVSEINSLKDRLIEVEYFSCFWISFLIFCLFASDK